MATTERERVEKHVQAMEAERQAFHDVWRSISLYVQPGRGRFETNDRNQPRDYDRIINSRATIASRTLASGLMSGLTSPARPWFELGTGDPDVKRIPEVREWLRTLTKLMLQIFASGNLYEVLPNVYMELGLFGTACLSHQDDYDDVARFYPHTVGTYAIGQNSRLKVDTKAHRRIMTVEQMAQEFGLDNMSSGARMAYSRGDYQVTREVVSYISPRRSDLRRPGSPFAKDMPYQSVFYETGSKEHEFLRVSGFQEVPFYSPRWDVTEGDTYATTSPGFAALGDTRALQVLEQEKAIAIQKKNNPPLHGPGSLKNKPIASIPGGTTLYDGSGQGGGLQPIYQVQPELQETELTIQAHEARINEAFLADLFAQLANLQGVQPRNQQELAMRNEEKLLQLGPFLERAQSELLDPLVDRTAQQVFRAEIMPPPPEVLFGQRLNVTYIGPLAVAQRQVSAGSIERFVGYVGLVSQIDPSAADMMDGDEVVNEIAEVLGTPPRLVRDSQSVEQIREARAEQQQQAEMLETAQVAAGAAKDAGIDLGGDQ